MYNKLHIWMSSYICTLDVYSYIFTLVHTPTLHTPSYIDELHACTNCMHARVA